MRAARVVIRSMGIAVVSALLGAACSDGDPPAANPDLECDGEASNRVDADLDPSTPGGATADEALDEHLRALAAQLGRGEVVEVRDGVQALVIDGRRIAVAEARPAPAGGFQVDTMSICRPYLDEISPAGATPATAAPASAVSDEWCAGAVDALDPSALPTDGAGVVDALLALDASGLDEGGQRTFAGLVSALERSVDAFVAGQGPNGWTTNEIADFVSRHCGVDLAGFTVMP